MGSRGRVRFAYKRELTLSNDDKNHIIERHSSSSVIPNKTRFPKDWDDRRIIQAVDETIDSPDRIVRPIPPNQRYQIEKDFDDATVRVSYYYDNGEAVFHSAYPLP
jgi:hypothetical protein